MKLKKKSKLLLFLFLAVLFQQLPARSQSYVITEEQLEQLEANNEKLKKLLNERQAELNEREKELNERAEEIENLKTLSNQMMQSLNKSEKEKKTIKTLALIGGGVCLVGGILFGAWIASINK